MNEDWITESQLYLLKQEDGKSLLVSVFPMRHKYMSTSIWHAVTLLLSFSQFLHSPWLHSRKDL